MTSSIEARNQRAPTLVGDSYRRFGKVLRDAPKSRDRSLQLPPVFLSGGASCPRQFEPDARGRVPTLTPQISSRVGASPGLDDDSYDRRTHATRTLGVNTVRNRHGDPQTARLTRLCSVPRRRLVSQLDSSAARPHLQ